MAAAQLRFKQFYITKNGLYFHLLLSKFNTSNLSKISSSLKSDFQPQGIRGDGLTTGASYQWTGATQASFNGQVGYENTFINNYRLIGEGPNNNLLIHQTFHATVQPDGEVTTFVDDYSVECK